jgi:hypothetical protein
MSISDSNSSEEQEQDSQEEGTFPLASSSSSGDVPPLTDVGALLSQLSNQFQRMATGSGATRAKKVQELKLRLQQICPTFTGNFVSFELSSIHAKQLLKEAPEISPEFMKNQFYVQRRMMSRNEEDMLKCDETMVHVSRKLSGALIYLLSTVFPKTQKGHVKQKEAIFRAICLVGGALNEVQTERFTDPLVRQCLVTTREKDEVPDRVQEVQKQLFFPVAAGGGDPSGLTSSDEADPWKARFDYSRKIGLQKRPYRGRGTVGRFGGPIQSRPRSITPPHEREQYRRWVDERMAMDDLRRKTVTGDRTW